MVTPDIKDQILNDILAEQQPLLSIDVVSKAEKYGITPFLLTLVYEQFHDMKLIRLETTKSDDVDVFVKMAAWDYQRLGGFVSAEGVILALLEKLQLEIEGLQKSLPERAAQWATILANLATIGTALGLQR
jgi:hypothetical protein